MNNKNWFKDTFELKKIDVNKLKEWEINPRIHTSYGVRLLTDSFDEFGCMSNIVCDNDFTIISGHARKKILSQKECKVDCWVAKEKLKESDFRKMALLSNKTYSEFNGSVLADYMDPFELMDIGFAPTEIELADEEVYIDEGRILSDFKGDYHKLVLKFDSEDEYMIFIEKFSEFSKDYPNETKASVFKKYINHIMQEKDEME